MRFCVKYFGIGDAYFGKLEEVILTEYKNEIKKYSDMKCYCKDHISQ